MKEEVQKHFEFLSNMSIKELTLYKTWHQINNKRWIIDERNKVERTKDEIWVPKNPDDFLNIEPEIIIPENKNDHLAWRILRYFTSSAPTLSIPGRSIRIIVKDKVTNTYLGIMQLGSDFSALGPRDNYIGWTREHKEVNRMLNYLAMGFTIVPTQPLGFNYVGGKLMTLLLCSDVVENAWNSKYSEPVIAMTTTSLYGGFSQYNGLKYWNKRGTTEGKIPIEPDDTITSKLRHWMKRNYLEEFKKIDGRTDKSSPKTRIKSNISNFCYSKLGIKPPESNAQRGVYFCELYDNVKPFLKMETNDYGNRKFDNSVESLVNLWKTKYAKKRIEGLLKKDIYNTNTLFYNDVLGMSWEDTKKKYIYGEDIKRVTPFDLFFN